MNERMSTNLNKLGTTPSLKGIGNISTHQSTEIGGHPRPYRSRQGSLDPVLSSEQDRDMACQDLGSEGSSESSWRVKTE